MAGDVAKGAESVQAITDVSRPTEVAKREVGEEIVVEPRNEEILVGGRLRKFKQG